MAEVKNPAATLSSRFTSGKTLSTLGELGVPIAVLAIIVALITPLPGFILDLLIVFKTIKTVILRRGSA